MRAVLRRGAWGLAGDAPTLPRPAREQYGTEWRLVRPRRELYRPDGTECRLTTAEFDLFCLLVDCGPSAVSREAICREVFRRRWRSEDRTVDNLVVRLRRKLDDEARSTVRTLQGRGYAFVGFEDAELREG
jgi:DNA-binding response OmpR family regulator